MNAINHAVTALVIKKYHRDVPLLPLLISVQLIEMVWVILNVTGVETTRINAQVHSLADVHLEHMPFSHSVVFTLMWAAVGWLFVRNVLKKPQWALAVFIGICSHIVLDILTHIPDIEIIPFLGLPELGSGLYDVTVFAFIFELGYSIVCWKIIRGHVLLLIGLVALQLFSLTFYVPQISGFEVFFADYPQLFAPVIGVHIVFGLLAVAYLYHLDKKTAESRGVSLESERHS